MSTTPVAEPESSPKPEKGPKTLFPEVMGNQETFLMYGIFILALFVFCIVLLVLYIKLNKRFKKFKNSGNGNFHMRATTGKVDPAVF